MEQLKFVSGQLAPFSPKHNYVHNTSGVSGK